MRVLTLLSVIVFFLAIVFSIASIGNIPVTLMIAVGGLLLGIGVLLNL